MCELLQGEDGKRLKQAAPPLRNLCKLKTGWMNGIQFYLKRDISIVDGHVLYVGTPWALTSISQQQFWEHYDLGSAGDGCVNGLLSVDISDWEKNGIFGKPASECNPQEVKDDVWEQLKRCLNYGRNKVLDDGDLHSWFMNKCIIRLRTDHFAYLRDNPQRRHMIEIRGQGDENLRDDEIDLEPLFINEVGSARFRPSTQSGLPNFMLASDYVRTNTDLATMEAANEAGWLAANAILEAEGIQGLLAEVWPLHQPWYVRPWQALDCWRFRHGHPHILSDKNMRLRPGDRPVRAASCTPGADTTATD
jgi:hypothetical protein